MIVKFQYGIKSYSGTLDGINYANYNERDVVVGRMIPQNREVTAAHILMGQKMIKISNLYEATTALYKADLLAYSKQMFKLKAFKGKLAGNGYSVFVKMIWAASKSPDNPLDIMSLTVDDLEVGSYSQIETVKAAIENGLLPKVEGYEIYENSAR